MLISFGTSETSKKNTRDSNTSVFTLDFFKVLCSILNNSETLDKLLKFTKPWSPHPSNKEDNLILLSMLAWESMQKGTAGGQAPMSAGSYYIRKPTTVLKTICFVFFTLAIVF